MKLSPLSPRALPFVVACMFVAPMEAAAQCVSLTTPGAAATQSFDTLSSTAGSTTNNLTLTGWFMTETGGGARDNEQYAVDTGGSNTGDTYSYGAAASTERAFGGLQSGTLIPTFGACFTNNTGVTISDLAVAYTGEQWRLGTAARTDQINFEYSTTATSLVTGSWTGVAALNFVTPNTATTGAKDGNAAANRTAVSSTIASLSIANGATFWIRWTDTNASGADDGLAVDDFSITPNSGPVTPNLSIDDVAVTEGNSGTITASFTVSLSAPAGPGGVTFDIATADNTATTADNDYISNSLTGQTIAAGNSSYIFNVTVNGDTAIEANQTFFVNVTNVTGAVVIDGQGQGTINNDDVSITAIHDIQGPGASSPLVGASVTVRGVVTGVRSNGFFVQEEEADYDADPATSEGILVFTSSAPPIAAAVGNVVQVTGTVVEFVPSADPLQPPLTELSSPTVVVISSGNPLPSPVPLNATFPDPVGPHDQLERVEGMRVSVSSLTVGGPTMGNVNETNATATSTGVFYGTVTGVPRAFREAGIQAPDPAPSGTIPPIPRFDSNPERIRVDSDGLVGAGTVLNLGTGAIVTGLVGPLDYTFRTYTILPESTPSVSGGPAATAVSTPLGSEFTVASYNLERFFDTVNDPGIGEPVLTATAFNNRLAKASLGIRDYLKTPDILGVVEVENLATLQSLAARISSDAIAASQPDPAYNAYLVEGNDVGGIDVGFLVKTNTVFGTTPRVEVIEVVQELDGSLFVNPDSSTETLNDRPPLRLKALVHHPNGASFPVTVIVNHLRSLIGVGDTGPGSNGWATAGERIRAKRQKQAEDLANLVQGLQVADPTERIILVGDFNAFEFNDGFGDTMGVITGNPAPDNETVVPGDGIDLVNPDLTNLASSAPPLDRYSFVFDGNAQSLDHALINAPLIGATLARREEHARINADFPETDRSNASGATRLADHDPLVAYFQVAAFLGVNADLSDLTLSSGSFTPAFSAGTTSYSTVVGAGVASVTVTPTAADPAATIGAQVNGGGFASVASGTPSSALAINAGPNNVEVRVTAEDTVTIKTYSVSVYRCPTITLPALPNGTIGTPYSASAAASGGSGSYTYAVTGTLPPNLMFAGSTLSGTPSAVGTFTFQVTATDVAGPGTCTGVGVYNVTIGSVIAPGNLVIREFRSRGPAGAHDEYVEVMNKTAAPLTLAATDGSAGFGIAGQSVGACPAGSAQVLASIPNGTVIPAGGFYLAANSTSVTGYSLANYGGALASTADATWTTDLCDNGGVGLFTSSSTIDATTRLDAVGFVGSTAPFVEGAGIPVPAGTGTAEVAYLRNAPLGVIQDTGVNANDFFLGDASAGTFGAVTARLASPGPQNANSEKAAGLTFTLADPTKGATVFPNRWRTTTTATTGTYYFRWKVTNNTGAPITKLRIRVANVTTLNSPGYVLGGSQADFRLVASPDVGISVPGAVTALGLTPESPTTPGLDGGYHASAFATLPGGTLANGASVYVNVALRYAQAGAYVYFVSGEAK